MLVFAPIIHLKALSDHLGPDNSFMLVLELPKALAVEFFAKYGVRWWKGQVTVVRLSNI
jgi:hypothetical protein